MGSPGEIRSGSFVSQSQITLPDSSCTPSSSLPLELLTVILSLLSHQDVEAASKVSKMWRSVAQSTPLFLFQKFQAAIEESVAARLDSHQRKELREGLKQAASLLKPTCLLDVSSWKRVITGSILPELKQALIGALRRLDEECLAALNQTVSIRFAGCEYLFQLAKLSRIIGSEAYRNTVGNRQFESTVYKEVTALRDAAIQQDPDGVLVIAKLEAERSRALGKEPSSKAPTVLKEERVTTFIVRAMLRKVLSEFLGRGEPKKAFKVAKLLLPDANPTFLLDVTYALAKSGHVKETIEAAKLLLQTLYYRQKTTIIENLAASFATAGNLQGFLAMVAELEQVKFEALGEVDDREFKQKQVPLSKFWKGCLESGHVEAAFGAIRLFTPQNCELRDEGLEAIAQAFLEKGEVGKAREAARLISNDKSEILKDPRFLY